MGIILSSQHIYEVEKVSDKILFLKQGKPFEEEQGTVFDSTASHLVVELELLNASKREVETHFNPLKPTEIIFNGGIYVLRFEETTMPQVLASLANSALHVVYIRDITRSASRYFLQP
jgi:ABC-2 type transport system ATP-binding protein